MATCLHANSSFQRILGLSFKRCLPSGLSHPFLFSLQSTDLTGIMENMKRGGILSVLLALLLLAWTKVQSVGAVNVYFWSASGCQGSALACYNLPVSTCCFVPATATPTWRPAVQVTNSASCKSTRVYTGSSCSSEWGRVSNNFCISGQTFRGAKWFKTTSTCPSRRRQLLADTEEEEKTCPDGSTSCKTMMEPNAISYKDPSGKGIWNLIKENVLGSYEEFMNLPDAEKVAWLTKQGAAYTTLPEKAVSVKT